MITFKFDIEKQKSRYKFIKEKVKKNFYQEINLYVLPFMPEKFRNRVIFLPLKYEPEKIYKKQKNKIKELEKNWKKEENMFVKKVKEFFPDLDSVNITISPVFYGSVGSYKITGNEIMLMPRYDRKFINLQKLFITALTHYFLFDKDKTLENDINIWKEKQNKASEINDRLFGLSKHKSFIKVLDTEFAGSLAEESVKYLNILGVKKSPPVDLSNLGLTRKERIVFNLLLQNKNKLVSFDLLADEIWKEKVEEKYSLYALSTIIKKLRRKIKNKTKRNLIQSQRGIGYILHI